MIHTVLEKHVVRVLTFAQILNGIGVAGTVAAGSLLVSSITHSDSLAGLAQTSAVLGAAAMALPLSRLTERGGRRLALSIGYVIGVIGASLAIVGGTSRVMPILLLGTFLLGAASAAGYQARFAAVDLASADTRSRSLSIVVWGSTVGAVSGPNLMEPVGRLAHALGLPKLVGPYLLAVVTLALSALIIFYFLRPDPYLTSRHIASARVESDTRVSTRSTLKRIRKNSPALFAVVSIAVGHLSMVTIMVMTPIHMAHVDVTLSVIGMVISTHIAGMYVLSPIVGYLSDKIGRKRVIQIGLATLLLAAMIAGNSAGNSTIALGIGLFLLGVGWSCTLIAGSALLSESVGDEERAASQGASDFIMNLTGAFGGVMAGIIIALLSYGWLCALASLPVLLLAAWSYRLGK
ncbi:MAG TPA: MFS transporter [Candidatus Paceibacterota bacterium]|nr:MFS transporter [Candidatus Paceibacterota bacterium]